MRNGRFTIWIPRSRSLNIFLTFYNCKIPWVHLTTIILSCSLLSAPFLSESDKAECWDILSSSTPLHNPGNILPLCAQPSGDLAPGSAAAMARWQSAYSGSPILQELCTHTDGSILKSTALSRKISVWIAHLWCFLLGSHCNLIQAVPQDWLKSPCHPNFQISTTASGSTSIFL